MKWPTRAEMAAFYGNPDANGDGLADASWERANLVIVTCPWELALAWAPTVRTRKIQVNKKCADSLGRVLGVIWELHGKDQARIEKQRMHLFGGGYNFRVQRGAKKPILSTHAYGAAVDFDPERNAMGKRWVAGMISLDVVRAFRDEGWVWGGNFPRPDAMHFQAAQ